MALKTKKSTDNTSTKTTTSKKTTGNKIDALIAQKREQVQTLNAEIKDLLAQKLNETSGKFKVGEKIYYPAPPQKAVIACILEIEENSKGEITYFARPICVDKKTGKETLSKRHYSLGTDLSECADIYSEPLKKAKSTKETKKAAAEKPTAKTTAKKAPAKKEEETPATPAKKSLPKKKLGKAKK